MRRYLRAMTSGDARSPFLPLLLLTIALLLWVGFQTTQLWRERSNLQTVRANQEAPIEQSTKLRSQLDSIARRTAELAGQGNTGARTIVEELRKRGITINPSAPPVPPPR